jgi:hypothetical protein
MSAVTNRGPGTWANLQVAVMCVSLLIVAGLLVSPNQSSAASTGWGGPYVVVPAKSHATVIEGVACASTTHCVALDANGNVYTYGNYGSAPFLITAHIDTHVNGNGNNMTGLSCASTTLCVAIDNQGYAVVFNGTSWGAPTLLDGDGQGSVPLLGVSCPTTTFCAVSDHNASVTLYQSGVWGTPQIVDVTTSSPAPEVTAVSCSSAVNCWAVDSAGNAMNWNGASWGAPQAINHGVANATSNGQTMTSVSCPTTTFCMAGDAAGEVAVFNGTAWAPSSPGVTNTSYDSISALSCSSANFCIAALHATTASASLGDVLAYENGAWGTPISLNSSSTSSSDVSAVSCPSDLLCAAGSANGAMFIYQTPTPEIKIVTTRSIVYSSRVPISISCAQGPCKGVLQLVGKAKAGSGARDVVLAAGRYALALVGTTWFATVEIDLTRSGLRAFAHSAQRAVTVRASATVLGGASYKTSLQVN